MPNFLLPPPSASPLGGDQIIVSYNFEWYKFVAYAIRQIIPAYVWDTPPSDVGDQVDTLVYLLGVPVQIHYPDSAQILGGLADVSQGNALSFSVSTTQMLNGAWLQNTAANGDELVYHFSLAAGGYHFRRWHTKASDSGKVDWYIDGVKVISLQDLYNGTTVVNDLVSSDVDVLTDGNHELVATINGKNGSSSSYRRRFHMATLSNL